MATANYGWLKEYDGSTFFPGTKPTGNSEKPVYIGTNGLPVEIEHTIKNDVPENAEFTDTKVTQKAAITTDGEYPIILANSTATTEETNTVNKTSTLKYNPSTKTLTTDTIDINSLKLNQNVYHFTDADGDIIATINSSGISATQFNGPATKLGTTDKGSTKKPIYLKAGVPTEIGYTIESNVPSGAEFTDTTYSLSGALSGNTFVNTLKPSSGSNTTATVPAMTAATASAAGKAGLVPAPAAAKNTSFLRGDGTWSKSTDTFEVTGNVNIGGTLDVDTIALNKDVYTFHDTDNNAIATIDDTGITATNFKGKINGFTIAKDLPSTAKLTDTTYSAGNGISQSGTVFSHADTSSASNLTANGRKYVTGLTFDTYGHVTGYTTGSESVTDTNTTYDLTTTSSTSNGKLNLVAGGSGSGTDTVTIKGSGAATVTSDASGNITVNSTNTTYDNATQTTAGLMSANDKKRLDAMTDNADAVSFSRSLSSGTKIGTITINGTGTDLYCETNTDTQLTLYSASECTDYISDDGALTPAAVKKACAPTLSNSSTQSGISISYKNGIGDSSSTVIQNATQSLPGAMSSSDKTKLDNIETGTWSPMPCTETTLVGPQVMNGYYTKIGNIVTIIFQGYWIIGSAPPWDEINNGNTFYIDATALPYRFVSALTNPATGSETRVFYSGGGYVRGLRPIGDDSPFSGFQLTRAGMIYPRVSRRINNKELPGYMTCDAGDEVWITGSITYITDGAPEWGMEQWDSDM